MLLAFLLSAVALAFSAETRKARRTKAASLLTALPASDAALVFDAKRFFDTALPQILASDQPKLASITNKVEEIRVKTGIDLRQFQQVVVGANINQLENRIDVEPLILARGQINADALVALAKVASNGKYREEKIGAKTIYVFTPKELLEKNKGQSGNAKRDGIVDQILSGFERELALTSYDANTLAFGSTARVRHLLDARRPRLGAEVAAAAARRPNAVMSFAARVPNGLSQFIKLDNDELGRNLDAVRLISGTVDVAGENATVTIAAKTVDAAQAKGLKDFISALQLGFSGLLKGSNREDQRIYGRMLESARIVQSGSEVTLDVQMPQADINVLLGRKR